MKRLALITLATLVVSAGVASAAQQQGGDPAAPAAAQGPAARISVPAAPPAADPAHPGMSGYVTAARLARAMTPPASEAPAGSGTITVTAIVLPVRTIVVEGGEVTSIWTNTDKLGARDTLYVFRDGARDGDVVPLTPALWAQARTAFAHAVEADADGRIY